MRSAPVRQHKSLKAPILLQDIREQILVFAGIVAVDRVVGAHDRAGLPDAIADFECQQVRLAHGSLIDDCVGQIAARFLVVDGVVLQLADHVLRLLTADALTDDGAGQDWVLAVVLKVAPVAEFPGQVHSSREAHVEALCPLLPANQRPILAGGFRIPTCGRGQVRGQRCGVAAVHRAEAYSVGRTDHLERRNAQPRYAQ